MRNDAKELPGQWLIELPMTVDSRNCLNEKGVQGIAKSNGVRGSPGAMVL